MLDSQFVVLGAVISFFGGGAYALSTLRGKTRPNLVTWVLWTIAPAVAFVAELNKGVGLQALMTFMVGFMPLLVVIAALLSRRHLWQATRFDVACGLLSLVGLLLWWLSREGDVAIWFSIVADGLAAVPTIVKAYRHPRSESSTAYVSGAVNAAITLLTVDRWTFANYGFPLYILLVCALLSGLILFPRRRLVS